VNRLTAPQPHPGVRRDLHISVRLIVCTGGLAAALAKAQGELSNPEKSLTATIRSPPARRTGPSAMPRWQWAGYRPQKPWPARDRHGPDDRDRSGLWPNPARRCWPMPPANGSRRTGRYAPSAKPLRRTGMGAALTCARRSALFALVGIAGEDDLDAPDRPNLKRGKRLALADVERTLSASLRMAGRPT
jgi:hypothetical protein